VTRVVGLTGGIGTGKSTVSRLLAELGAEVIDSDAIVHELQAPGTPLLAAIEEAFGPEVIRPDGSLDRAAVASIVFRDEASRRRLNALVHPAVGRETARRLEAARARGARLVILDIPLLFETRLAGSASRANLGATAVVVVYAPRELQVRRLVERNGYERAEAERRVEAQLPIEEKRERADYVIDNSGSLEETRRQVQALYERLVGRDVREPPAEGEPPC
jgi:dephospho-CoA kinase